MKNIKNYNNDKYNTGSFKEIEKGIYLTKFVDTSKYTPIKEEDLIYFDNIDKWDKENGIETLYKDKNKYVKIYNQILKQEIEEKNIYVMSISFEQEPEYNENSTNEKISQYPLNDILEKFGVFVSDNYKEIN